jgi:hypothetical protein
LEAIGAFGGFWYAALISGLYKIKNPTAPFPKGFWTHYGALFVLHSLLLCPILTPQEAKGTQERPHQGQGNVAHMPSRAENTERKCPRQGRERRGGRLKYDYREVA